MEQSHRNQITQNLTNLLDNTIWNPLLDQKLLEKNIFNDSMLQDLKKKDKPLLEMYIKLKTRGPQAFASMVAALQDSGNLKAARILNPSITVNFDGISNTKETRESKVWNEPVYQEGAAANNGNVYSEYTPPPIPADSTNPLVVSVRKSKQFVTHHPVGVYHMQSKPRGYALIIDNEDFEHPMFIKRTGSMVDANNLDILFEELGFKVTLRRNLQYRTMMDEITKFSRKPELANGDMLIVCIMSHGQNGRIAGSDGRELETAWVIRQFNNDGCPALRGKPKFFILQACRGDETDFGSLKMTQTAGTIETDAKVAKPPTNESLQQYTDPSWEDMLIAYATLPGYVANRDIYRGTWFVEALTQIFMDRACELEIREMLDQVAKRLKGYETERGTKQSFAYEVIHFYKKLYFNPGLYNQ